MDAAGGGESLTVAVWALLAKLEKEHGCMPVSRTWKEADEECQFVENNENSVVHDLAEGRIGTHPRLWKTKCGWKFAGANHKRVSGQVGRAFCAKCADK